MLIDLSYTNFIMLCIYGEALDRLRVRLNMKAVHFENAHLSSLNNF